MDTHVNPAAESLLRYVEKKMVDRAAQGLQSLRGTMLRYDRVAGRKQGDKVRESSEKNPFGATFRATRPIADGVLDDNSAGRLADMDLEGADINFVIPNIWAYASVVLEPDIVQCLHRAYHRYMADYCSADPRRLKSQIIFSAADPHAAAQAIREYAREEWVAAVWAPPHRRVTRG